MAPHDGRLDPRGDGGAYPPGSSGVGALATLELSTACSGSACLSRRNRLSETLLASLYSHD